MHFRIWCKSKRWYCHQTRDIIENVAYLSTEFRWTKYTPLTPPPPLGLSVWRISVEGDLKLFLFYYTVTNNCGFFSAHLKPVFSGAYLNVCFFSYYYKSYVFIQHKTLCCCSPGVRFTKFKTLPSLSLTGTLKLHLRGLFLKSWLAPIKLASFRLPSWLPSHKKLASFLGG